MIYFAGIQLSLFAPRRVAPAHHAAPHAQQSDGHSPAQIKAARALADWHGEQPEPRRRSTPEERASRDANVACFYHELAEFRKRHPEKERADGR